MENQGFVLGMLAVAPVNQHDTILLPDGLDSFIATMGRLRLDLTGSHITLDSGFDSKENRGQIRKYKLIPQIYPNRRNTKRSILIAQKFRWFNREVYKERFAVERTFGWQDTYRKLAISYDRLPEIRKGCRNLAYAMVNFRATFGKNL